MALRVIAGSAGGIPLRCPRSKEVRPTMEQVRGAIFSSLAEFVPDARVEAMPPIVAFAPGSMGRR